MIGSVPELGSWDPKSSIPLNMVMNNCIWSITLELPETFEYKYMIYNDHSNVVTRWEECGNRKMNVSTFLHEEEAKEGGSITEIRCVHSWNCEGESRENVTIQIPLTYGPSNKTSCERLFHLAPQKTVTLVGEASGTAVEWRCKMNEEESRNVEREAFEVPAKGERRSLGSFDVRATEAIVSKEKVLFQFHCDAEKLVMAAMERVVVGGNKDTSAKQQPQTAPVKQQAAPEPAQQTKTAQAQATPQDATTATGNGSAPRKNSRGSRK